MRQGPHHHYDQLADRERDFVDAVFDGKTLYELAKEFSVPLAGDDRVERAVDALARAVIESRPEEERPANIIDNMQAMQRISGSPTGQKG